MEFGFWYWFPTPVSYTHLDVYKRQVDNYVVEEMNIFKLISDAITPGPVINLFIENIEQPRAKKVNEIIKLFKKLNYYED